MALLAAEDT